MIREKFNKIRVQLSSRKVKIFSIIIFLVVILSIIQVQLKADEMIDPLEIINIFYDELLSEKTPMECSEIFSDPEMTVSAIPEYKLKGASPEWTATAKIWFYLRKNKDVFLFQDIAPESTLDKVLISYVFSGVATNHMFFEGDLGIQLSCLLSGKDGQGVRKEIYFSFNKNDSPIGLRYLLEVCTIRINGFDLDLSDELNRSGDFYKKLGF